MKRLMQLFLPREKELYELFKDLSSVSVEMSLELDNLLKSYSKLERTARKEKIAEMKIKKLFAEDLHFKIIKKLDHGKEHDKRLLEKMANGLLESCKLLYASFSFLAGAGIERIDGQMIKFSGLLLDMSSELAKCISGLRKSRGKEHCQTIHKLERQADELFAESMGEIFHFFKNSLDVIKYKSFYENLERTSDCINDCALMISRMK